MKATRFHSVFIDKSVVSVISIEANYYMLDEVKSRIKASKLGPPLLPEDQRT